MRWPARGLRGRRGALPRPQHRPRRDQGREPPTSSVRDPRLRTSAGYFWGAPRWLTGISLSPVVGDEGWFQGDEPRHDDEARFLAAMRAAAAQGGLGDVTAGSTSVMALTGFIPMLLRVEVPGLPPALANLQVGYMRDDAYVDRLVGEWGDQYLLDNHGRYPDDLSVEGVDARPEEHARFAVGWLRRQLLRPIDRLDWCVVTAPSARSGASRTRARRLRRKAASFSR